MKHRTFCNIAMHSMADWPTCKSKFIRVGNGAPGMSSVWMTLQTVESEVTGRTLMTVTTAEGTEQLGHNDAMRVLTILELTLDPVNLATLAETFMSFSEQSKRDVL